MKTSVFFPAASLFPCCQSFLPAEKLLRIHRLNGFQGVTSSARSLLRTPRITHTKKTTFGYYFHYGLGTALRDQLRITKMPMDAGYTIQININIDGLPIAKSSKSQLWPILGQIHHPQFPHLFVIGAFHGHSKPSCPFEVLEEFINEFNTLTREGFEFSGTRYTIAIRAVICDSPARAFITCAKGHTGYFGCSKCLQEGEYRQHKMLFLDENHPLRTDSGFKNRVNEEHHTGISPFEHISLLMVSTFPLDYMHLVCLGVVKKMISLWLKGYQTTKLDARNIKKLSEDLISMVQWIPVEFCRKPRGLDEFDRWKATEFCLFLLYLSPVILHEYLPRLNVQHICSLQCAIFILCHPTDCMYNNDDAKELLTYFVQTMKLLYGEETIIYNVHNLVHLPEDVKLYGPLDSFSAFPFENHMQVIKKSLRKGSKPLAQLHNRIIERNSGVVLHNSQIKSGEPVIIRHRGRKLPSGSTCSNVTIQFRNFELSSMKKADKCCYLEDGRIMRIKDIGIDGEKNCTGQILLNTERLQIYPCDSRSVGIHVGNQWSNIQTFNINEISTKAIGLPYRGKFCFYPLLHTRNTQGIELISQPATIGLFSKIGILQSNAFFGISSALLKS
ncbi:uncharacterized protein LOC125502070 [Athalia rosae]|uniref:uncharacterized protein LOC125502070 n=1 Tax=Athalia rosae TaxID=37344 RepID=UPI0020340B5E|nr:uncharacterized protein LOC125502070 [Athalia rosae]